MDELVWHGRLYCRLVGARIRAQLQYRLSFALDLIGAFFVTGLDFLSVLFIFGHLHRLAGWTLYEVAFLYGTANLSFALCDLVVGHLDEFPGSIRDGSFDLLLVRPVGSLFQVISSDLALRRIGRAAQGLAVLIFAISRLPIPWTPGRVAMMILMIPTGAVIYGSIWIMGATIAFWTVDAREITNAFTYGGSYLASYPINIFGGWLRRLLAFVVPMGFVSYFPALYILDHPDPLHAPEFLPFLTPLVALTMVLVAGRVWLFGVRHYRSTGS